MPSTPSIAIVIEGGLVQVALVEDWPGQAPLPRIVIVDYDDDDTPEDELTSFNIGNEVVDVRCHEEIPCVYESFTKPALSPRAASGGRFSIWTPRSMTVSNLHRARTTTPSMSWPTAA